MTEKLTSRQRNELMQEARRAAESAYAPYSNFRQWLSELAPRAIILIAGHDREYSITDLLPDAFRLR
jgi:cytidine deaminase